MQQKNISKYKQIFIWNLLLNLSQMYHQTSLTCIEMWKTYPYQHLHFKRTNVHRQKNLSQQVYISIPVWALNYFLSSLSNWPFKTSDQVKDTITISNYHQTNLVPHLVQHHLKAQNCPSLFLELQFPQHQCRAPFSLKPQQIPLNSAPIWSLSYPKVFL